MSETQTIGRSRPPLAAWRDATDVAPTWLRPEPDSSPVGQVITWVRQQQTVGLDTYKPSGVPSGPMAHQGPADSRAITHVVARLVKKIPGLNDHQRLVELTQAAACDFVSPLFGEYDGICVKTHADINELVAWGHDADPLGPDAQRRSAAFDLRAEFDGRDRYLLVVDKSAEQHKRDLQSVAERSVNLYGELKINLSLLLGEQQTHDYAWIILRAVVAKVEERLAAAAPSLSGLVYMGLGNHDVAVLAGAMDPQSLYRFFVELRGVTVDRLIDKIRDARVEEQLRAGLKARNNLRAHVAHVFVGSFAAFGFNPRVDADGSAETVRASLHVATYPGHEWFASVLGRGIAPDERPIDDAELQAAPGRFDVRFELQGMKNVTRALTYYQQLDADWVRQDRNEPSIRGIGTTLFFPLKDADIALKLSDHETHPEHPEKGRATPGSFPPHPPIQGLPSADEIRALVRQLSLDYVSSERVSFLGRVLFMHWQVVRDINLWYSALDTVPFVGALVRYLLVLSDGVGSRLSPRTVRLQSHIEGVSRTVLACLSSRVQGVPTAYAKSTMFEQEASACKVIAALTFLCYEVIDAVTGVLRSLPWKLDGVLLLLSNRQEIESTSFLGVLVVSKLSIEDCRRPLRHAPKLLHEVSHFQNIFLDSEDDATIRTLRDALWRAVALYIGVILGGDDHGFCENLEQDMNSGIVPKQDRLTLQLVRAWFEMPMLPGANDGTPAEPLTQLQESVVAGFRLVFDEAVAAVAAEQGSAHDTFSAYVARLLTAVRGGRYRLGPLERFISLHARANANQPVEAGHPFSQAFLLSVIEQQLNILRHCAADAQVAALIGPEALAEYFQQYPGLGNMDHRIRIAVYCEWTGILIEGVDDWLRRNARFFWQGLISGLRHRYAEVSQRGPLARRAADVLGRHRNDPSSEATLLLELWSAFLARHMTADPLPDVAAVSPTGPSTPPSPSDAEPNNQALS